VTLIGDYDASRLWDTAEAFTDISTLVRDEYNRAIEEDGFLDEYRI
jgi:hypothetical protein